MRPNPRRRVYVKVNSSFDLSGHMQPTSIIWGDGRVFRIERVVDFRPATAVGMSLNGDCYTVVICGQERHLFFERIDPRFPDRLGRWFVELPA